MLVVIIKNSDDTDALLELYIRFRQAYLFEAHGKQTLDCSWDRQQSIHEDFISNSNLTIFVIVRIFQDVICEFQE